MNRNPVYTQARPGSSGKPNIGVLRPDRESSKRLSLKRLMRGIGVAGIAVATLMLAWFIAGLAGLMPSMVDVFGVPGLRFPAGIAISGLLAASIGFNRF